MPQANRIRSCHTSARIAMRNTERIGKYAVTPATTSSPAAKPMAMPARLLNDHEERTACARISIQPKSNTSRIEASNSAGTRRNAIDQAMPASTQTCRRLSAPTRCTISSASSRNPVFRNCRSDSSTGKPHSGQRAFSSNPNRSYQHELQETCRSSMASTSCKRRGWPAMAGTQRPAYHHQSRHTTHARARYRVRHNPRRRPAVKDPRATPPGDMPVSSYVRQSYFYCDVLVRRLESVVFFRLRLRGCRSMVGRDTESSAAAYRVPRALG